MKIYIYDKVDELTYRYTIFMIIACKRDYNTMRRLYVSLKQYYNEDASFTIVKGASQNG